MCIVNIVQKIKMKVLGNWTLGAMLNEFAKQKGLSLCPLARTKQAL